MERLRENKFLMYAIAASSAVVVSLTFGLSADLNQTFEIIEFPEEVSTYQMLRNGRSLFNEKYFCFAFQFKKILVSVLVGDTVLAFAVDRICSFLFGSVRKSDIVTDSS